jgi:hypothetical protein
MGCVCWCAWEVTAGVHLKVSAGVNGKCAGVHGKCAGIHGKYAGVHGKYAGVHGMCTGVHGKSLLKITNYNQAL